MPEPRNQNAADKPTSEVEVRPNFLVRTTNRFPRTTRVLAVTGVIAVAAAGAKLVSNVRGNKDNLASAAEHAGDAFSEVAASVSSPDTEV